MSAPNHLPCITVKRWEDAGASLLTAFKNYADLCLSLGTDALNEGVKPEDLGTRIESILETVHAIISDQLPKATAIISRIRNNSVTPIFRFPNEVLAEIFTNVIFDRHNPDASTPTTMEQNLRMIYDHLHKLRRVCSTWNDVIIARGVLWSVVPLILGKNPSSYRMSLERAGSMLHLAADIETHDAGEIRYKGEADSIGKPLYELLSEYGPRFRAVDLVIYEGHDEILRGAIDRLLRHGDTLSLSQLSMSLHSHPRPELPGWHAKRGFPADHWWILPHDSPQQTSFASLLASLKTFRIHNVYFHWETMTFSTRLVELRIQNITLGYDEAIAPFLRALTSAPELRDLTIIDVRTFVKRDAVVDAKAFPVVTLPKLQHFLVDDLYLNTLELLLPKISPGSQVLKLCLGSKCLRVNTYGWRSSSPLSLPAYQYTEPNTSNEDDTDHIDIDYPPIGIQRLWNTLGSTQIDTLVLRPLREDIGLSGFLLHALLRVLPDLKTLKVDGWDILVNHYEWAPRRFIMYHEEQSDRCPLASALQNLYLTGITIHDKETLYEMVNSHSPKQIVIGGHEQVVHPDGEHHFRPLEESQPFLDWLRDNAPNVRLVDSEYHPTEINVPKWQPW